MVKGVHRERVGAEKVAQGIVGGVDLHVVARVIASVAGPLLGRWLIAEANWSSMSWNSVPPNATLSD